MRFWYWRCIPSRGGKETVTSINRQRTIAVSLKPPLLQGGESPTNVFGHQPLRAAQLKELCLKEESDQFKKLLIKAQDKAQKRQREVDGLYEALESGKKSIEETSTSLVSLIHFA